MYIEDFSNLLPTSPSRDRCAHFDAVWHAFVSADETTEELGQYAVCDLVPWAGSSRYDGRWVDLFCGSVHLVVFVVFVRRETRTSSCISRKENIHSCRKKFVHYIFIVEHIVIFLCLRIFAAFVQSTCNKDLNAVSEKKCIILEALWSNAFPTFQLFWLRVVVVAILFWTKYFCFSSSLKCKRYHQNIFYQLPIYCLGTEI